MEALLVVFMPLVLLLVGFAIMTGRSMSPASVNRTIISWCWKTLRWLWSDRTKQGGGGRPKRPPIRYRR